MHFLLLLQELSEWESSKKAKKQKKIHLLVFQDDKWWPNDGNAEIENESYVLLSMQYIPHDNVHYYYQQQRNVQFFIV